MSTERKAALRFLSGLRRAHSDFRMKMAKDFENYEQQYTLASFRPLRSNDTVLICGHPDPELKGRKGVIVKTWNSQKNKRVATVSLKCPLQKRYWYDDATRISQNRFDDRHVVIDVKYLLRKVPDSNNRYWRKKFRKELRQMRGQGFKDDIKNIQALRNIAETALAEKLPEQIRPKTLRLPSREFLTALADDVKKESKLGQHLMESWINLTISHVGFHKAALSLLG